MSEPFSCRRDCVKPDGQTWRDDVRASRACPLEGAPPPAPTDRALHNPDFGSPYFGRLPIIGPAPIYLGRAVLPDFPLEDPADGCPGAWYRVPLVASLDGLVRRRAAGGVRVPNPAFDEAPRLAQDAAQEFEAEQEQSIGYVERTIAARHARRMEARAAPQQPSARARPGRSKGARR